jgi:hypothetical protein
MPGGQRYLALVSGSSAKKASIAAVNASSVTRWMPWPVICMNPTVLAASST